MNEGFPTPSSETTIETRPYLADPQVMEKLLRGVARESVNCRGAVGQGILSHEDANKIDEKETAKAAAALLGRERRYATDTTWNAPGVIDLFVAKELNIQVRGSENILIAALNQFLAEIHQQLDLLNNPNPPPDWETKIQKVVDKYRNLLLGLPISAPVAETSQPALPDYLSDVVSVRAAEARPVAPASRSAPVADASKPSQVPGTPSLQPPAKKSGGLKWAAVAAAIIVVAAGGMFFLRKTPEESIKPSPEPAAQPKVEAKPGENKAAVPAQTASQTAGVPKAFLIKDGSIVEVDGQGKITRTLHLKDQSIHFTRIFGWNQKAGRYLAGVQSDSAGTMGMRTLYKLWLVDNAGAERLINESVLSAELSPDGSKIVYITGDAVLEIEDVSGEKGLELIGAYGATWNPHNNSAVFLKVADGRPVSPPESLEVAAVDPKNQTVQVLTSGSFDDIALECDPTGKWAFAVTGLGTGLPSFWRVPLQGGEPAQLTNVRLNEGETWVPTTYQTASWSRDGRWFLYDYSDAPLEQVWGLEIDEKGGLKQAVKLADGLTPQWLDEKSFVYLKRSGDKVEAVVEKLPGS